MSATVKLDEANVLVTFHGERFMWLKDSDGTGPLAPMHHIDPDGHVRIEHVFSESFAHVCSDGKIYRYGEVIGSIDELFANGQSEADK